MSTQWTLAARAAKMNSSAIREILKVTERPEVISFAGGLPSPLTFPVDAMRGALDRVLTELTGYYRDVLAVQTAPEVALVNADLADEIAPVAHRSTPEQTVRALDAILEARTALEGNVAPQLALEAMLLGVSLAARS